MLQWQNELVRARLQNEELEGELVRYKLLCVCTFSVIWFFLPMSIITCRYAEAVHQTEDAMSSHRLSTASARGSKRPSLSSLLSRLLFPGGGLLIELRTDCSWT